MTEQNISIEFTRARARSENTLYVAAVHSDSEPFQPDGRYFDHDPKK
jgi:hypothetical protein